jgi:hypothetical protein
MRPFCYERELPVEGFSANGEQWVNWLSQPMGPAQSAKIRFLALLRPHNGHGKPQKAKDQSWVVHLDTAASPL